jgi:putative ABC transport system permease protein
MKQHEFKNVDPPFWVAWHQAIASIRVRFLRHSVTAAGIALGIAFFASVMVYRQGDQPADDPHAGVRLQWLVITSLVMCLVGVTNSMLMSVTERYREIGTIKCLGASDGFIVRVFFLEALLLGLIGSGGGSLAGAVLMNIVQSFSGSALGIGPLLQVVLLGTGIGLAITVVAAIAPAYQAAKMPAAAALRVEV